MKTNKIQFLIIFLFFLYTGCLISFGRTFVGINFLGFRIGEFTMLLSLIFYLVFLVFYKRVNILNNFFVSKLQNLLIVFLLTFLFILYFNNGSILEPYSYKSSSYIWSIGSLFLSMLVFNVLNIQIKFIHYFYLLLVWVYYFSIYGINDQVQEFFLQYSDKFEYPKGTDLIIFFIFVTFISNRIMINKSKAFIIFNLSFALYLPLLAFKSRAGVIALIIYYLFEIITFKKTVKINIKYIFLLFIVALVFIQSVFLVTKSGVVQYEKINENVQFISEYRTPKDNRDKTFEDTRFLYIANDRIFSGDGNFNWRLQIWQDVYFDLKNQNRLLIGIGFNEKIPAMNKPFRSGNDGTNENVHNFIVNLLARGGIVHLTFYWLFIIFLYQNIKNKKYKIDFLIVSVPIYFVSFFDSSMENAHFPILFYFLIGFITFNSHKSKN